MRLVVLALLGTQIALVAWGAMKPSDEDSIRSAITAQFEAFRHHDSDAAFAIAAPQIQQKFADSKAFTAMVALAYPQVYRPRKVVFLDLVETGGLLLQQVLLTGPEGVEVLALYEMVLIDGVCGASMAACWRHRRGRRSRGSCGLL
jgi:hypothetical protein